MNAVSNLHFIHICEAFLNQLMRFHVFFFLDLDSSSQFKNRNKKNKHNTLRLATKSIKKFPSYCFFKKIQKAPLNLLA